MLESMKSFPRLCKVISKWQMLESMKKCFELYFDSLYQFWYISVFIATSSKKLDKRIYSSNQMKSHCYQTPVSYYESSNL